MSRTGASRWREEGWYPDPLGTFSGSVLERVSVGGEADQLACQHFGVSRVRREVPVAERRSGHDRLPAELVDSRTRRSRKPSPSTNRAGHSHGSPTDAASIPEHPLPPSEGGSRSSFSIRIVTSRPVTPNWP